MLGDPVPAQVMACRGHPGALRGPSPRSGAQPGIQPEGPTLAELPEPEGYTTAQDAARPCVSARSCGPCSPAVAIVQQPVAAFDEPRRLPGTARLQAVSRRYWQSRRSVRETEAEAVTAHHVVAQTTRHGGPRYWAGSPARRLPLRGPVARAPLSP